MRALRAVGSGLVEIVDAPDPELADGDVLVRIEASAVCGSERGVFTSGASANAGHEAAGTVIEAPSGSDVMVGDRVGISAVRGCGWCTACRSGLETRCVHGAKVAIGMHAELVAAPLGALRPVPNGVDAAAASLLTGDALGVPVRGIARAPHQRGDVVVIIGLGPVGLSHALVRSFYGAEVIGIDPSATRRRLAVACGATDALDVDDPIPAASLVIESTGRPECIRGAFDAVVAGGVVLQSGECSSVEIDPSLAIVHKEVTYVGAWYYTSSDYPKMLAAVDEGLPI
jgi:threonine dehydrogenase-like Zn-dependent dehydrogenase